MNLFQNINKVCKDKNISHSEFRLYMVLISYNSNKQIFPSLNTIAEDSGIKSIPDISKKLHNLEERGYIEIKRRKHQSNIYRIKDLKEPIKQSHPKSAEVKETKPEEVNKETMYKELENNFIVQTANVIAKYRNEPEPITQVYTFIRKIIKLNPEPVKYKIAFMLLVYVLKSKDKFCGELPYNYFSAFFGMKVYADFHKSIFNNIHNISDIPCSNNIPYTKIKRQI